LALKTGIFVLLKSFGLITDNFFISKLQHISNEIPSLFFFFLFIENKKLSFLFLFFFNPKSAFGLAIDPSIFVFVF
jgi:hypothetical protein